MQEVFYEETAAIQAVGSAKTKYYLVNTFSIISYVIAVIWLIISIMLFPVQGKFIINFLFAVLPFAVFLASGIVLNKIRDKVYVDYDYTFVSGSIRISRVIKNIKRKNVLIFDTANIEKLGNYGSETFLRYNLMPDKKTVFLTLNVAPSEGKNFYYVVANVGGQKYLLILECTELFISYLIRYSNRAVIENELLNRRK